MPQPKAYEVYYKTCSEVDNHNSYRQISLMIEKKFGTKDWATQINMPLVAIYIVDTWLAYEIATRIE